MIQQIHDITSLGQRTLYTEDRKISKSIIHNSLYTLCLCPVKMGLGYKNAKSLPHKQEEKQFTKRPRKPQWWNWRTGTLNHQGYYKSRCDWQAWEVLGPTCSPSTTLCFWATGNSSHFLWWKTSLHRLHPRPTREFLYLVATAMVYSSCARLYRASISSLVFYFILLCIENAEVIPLQLTATAI